MKLRLSNRSCFLGHRGICACQFSKVEWEMEEEAAKGDKGSMASQGGEEWAQGDAPESKGGHGFSSLVSTASEYEASPRTAFGTKEVPGCPAVNSFGAKHSFCKRVRRKQCGFCPSVTQLVS